jgi:hypothetical protein
MQHTNPAEEPRNWKMYLFVNCLLTTHQIQKNCTPICNLFNGVVRLWAYSIYFYFWFILRYQYLKLLPIASTLSDMQTINWKSWPSLWQHLGSYLMGLRKITKNIKISCLWTSRIRNLSTDHSAATFDWKTFQIRVQVVYLSDIYSFGYYG